MVGGKLSCIIHFHIESLCDAEKVVLRSPAGEVMGRLHGYELAALPPEVDVRC